MCTGSIPPPPGPSGGHLSAPAFQPSARVFSQPSAGHCTLRPMTESLKVCRRRARRLIGAALAGLLTALAAPATFPVAVLASEPLRSGTVVSGTGETPANPWISGMEGCVGAPTCSAWLQSGCAPAMAGADPALHASIVDVADLADGVTARSYDQQQRGLDSGPVIVQFWSTSSEYDVVDEPAGLDGQWCEELVASRLTTSNCPRSRSGGCEVVIPVDATFMTVNPRPDRVKLEWRLT